MIDKVQKIKEWISKTQDGLMDADGNFRTAADEASYNTLCNLDAYIDSLQKEPASDDLNTAAKEYANNITDKLGYKLQLRRAVCFGAKWQITKLVEEAGKHEVKVDAGGYPYIPQIELYNYLEDIPLAKEGDKYNVILIKEG